MDLVHKLWTFCLLRGWRPWFSCLQDAVNRQCHDSLLQLRPSTTLTWVVNGLTGQPVPEILLLIKLRKVQTRHHTKKSFMSWSFKKLCPSLFLLLSICTKWMQMDCQLEVNFLSHTLKAMHHDNSWPDCHEISTWHLHHPKTFFYLYTNWNAVHKLKALPAKYNSQYGVLVVMGRMVTVGNSTMGCDECCALYRQIFKQLPLVSVRIYKGSKIQETQWILWTMGFRQV